MWSFNRNPTPPEPILAFTCIAFLFCSFHVYPGIINSAFPLKWVSAIPTTPYDYHCLYQCSSLWYSKSLPLFPMCVAVLLLALVLGCLLHWSPSLSHTLKCLLDRQDHHDPSDLHNLHGPLLGLPEWSADCTGLLHILFPLRMNFSLPRTLTNILRLASFCLSLLCL